MKIKPLVTQEDWKAFKELRLDALLKHPEAFGASLEEEVQLSDDAFQSGFKTCEIFGAFKENKLIGCAGFYIYSSQKMAHRGCLFSMYTDGSHRNLGIANALINTIIEHAKLRVMQLHLTVVTSNHAAIRLYQKQGFNIYGTEPRSLKIGNSFYDEHLMVLKFL